MVANNGWEESDGCWFKIVTGTHKKRGKFYFYLIAGSQNYDGSWMASFSGRIGGVTLSWSDKKGSKTISAAKSKASRVLNDFLA